MANFEKPIIIVSKCLGFAPCRYNGISLPDKKIDVLKPFVEYKPVCPEVEIGLGIPRDPIRMVLINGKPELYQTATNRYVTEQMNAFVNNYLSTAGEVDGFILKDRSPSCGLKDVKLYSPNGMSIKGNASGFFGSKIEELYSLYPAETEGRLSNFTIREHFLTHIFISASFRKIEKLRSMDSLVKFHTENKFLIMAYNESSMRKLGKIAANHEKKDIAEVLSLYGQTLRKAFIKPAKFTANINILLHGLGFVSKNLSAKEKAYFLDCIEKYRDNKVPLSVPSGVLKAFLVRFEVEFLLKQTYFEPYPENLVEITDSGKGRNLK